MTAKTTNQKAWFFVLPVVALVFAGAAIGDLRDDKTLVYLWLRPMDRWPIVVGAALAAGADAREDLIFADTVKDPRHIAHATAVGLDDFTFDNRSEITQIARHAPGANVHVRIRVSNEGSVAHLSEKFGAPPADAVALLCAARDQGLTPRGVSFHVGSQCLEVGRYREALDLVRGIFDAARAEGLALEMVDIGGGFPVRYLDEQIDITAMGRAISAHYEALFDDSVQLVAEPGRAVVGDAAILVEPRPGPIADGLLRALDDEDLTRIKTPFVWTMGGRGRPITFYLDDIRFE